MMTKQRALQTISALTAALTIAFAGRCLSPMNAKVANAGPVYEAQYDLDGNGQIDVADIAQTTTGWGSTNPDFDGNGTVTLEDVMLVASRWGSSSDDTPQNIDVASQKKGAGVPSWDQGYWKNISDSQLQTLNSAWFYDWGVTSRFLDYSSEYVPMIWSDRLDWYGGEANIARLAAGHPGRYWLILNEPDLPEQANISPEQAAPLYHQIEGIILGADPTAKLIIGGASQVGWPQWPEQFLAAYQNLYGKAPTRAGSHTHFYPYADANSDPSVLAARTEAYLTNARAWVDSHGGGELWLTEFNVHTTEAAAEAYMTDIVPWLQNYNGIQRFAWFAIDASAINWAAGSLMDRSFNLTPLGELYASQ